MLNRIIHWRSLFLIVALAIVAGTVLYTRYLARKIDAEERQRVKEWIEANTTLQKSADRYAIALANMIIGHNEDMPLIATDEKGEIIDYHNIDTARMAADPEYLPTLLRKIARQNPPLEWTVSEEPPISYQVFHGDTLLQREVQYYPLVQLLLVIVFIVLLIALLTTQNKSTQNQVWAGMAKESAHQMGTPLTSLQGWVEVLRQTPANQDIVSEMEKDLDRLRLVSDRFGKIGSKPSLENHNLVTLVEQTMAYMKKRASQGVTFRFEPAQPVLIAPVSATLLEWVLENLLKNALDAMQGKGAIVVKLESNDGKIYIDVSDTGKGIPPAHLSRVFQPGFTTKKRGWGLGLTLSKRIITQVHKGQLFVKHSEPGKGTTFRIVLIGVR